MTAWADEYDEARYEDPRKKYFNGQIQNYLFCLLETKGFLTFQEINNSYIDPRQAKNFRMQLVQFKVARTGFDKMIFIPLIEVSDINEGGA